MNAFSLDPADRNLLLRSCGIKKQINWFLLIAVAFAIVMSAGEWMDAWQRRGAAAEASADVVRRAEIPQAPPNKPPLDTPGEPSSTMQEAREAEGPHGSAESEVSPAWTPAPQALEASPMFTSPASTNALNDAGFKSLTVQQSSTPPEVTTAARQSDPAKKVERTLAPAAPRAPTPAVAKEGQADPCARISLSSQVPISKSGIRKLGSGSAEFSNGCIARPGGALGSSRIISIDAASLSIRTTHGTIHFIDDGV